MRTRLSICLKKRRFGSPGDAVAAARESGLALFPYACDRCHRYHLTSRSKARRIPRPGVA